MILFAPLVLTFVSALPIEVSPACSDSKSLVRIYSDESCDDTGNWVELAASSFGVTAYGKSVRLDVPCGVTSTIFISNDQGVSEVGEFPATAGCIAFEDNSYLSIVSHIISTTLTPYPDSILIHKKNTGKPRSTSIDHSSDATVEVIRRNPEHIGDISTTSSKSETGDASLKKRLSTSVYEEVGYSNPNSSSWFNITGVVKVWNDAFANFTGLCNDGRPVQKCWGIDGTGHNSISKESGNVIVKRYNDAQGENIQDLSEINGIENGLFEKDNTNDDPLKKRENNDDPLKKRENNDDPLKKRENNDDPLKKRENNDDLLKIREKIEKDARHPKYNIDYKVRRIEEMNVPLNRRENNDDPLKRREMSDDPLLIIEEAYDGEIYPEQPPLTLWDYQRHSYNDESSNKKIHEGELYPEEPPKLMRPSE